MSATRNRANGSKIFSTALVLVIGITFVIVFQVSNSHYLCLDGSVADLVHSLMTKYKHAIHQCVHEDYTPQLVYKPMLFNP